MKLTESALKNPAGLAVAVCLLLLLGIMSLNQLPVQLFPDIERPQISIQTLWRAASPKEVESEIIEPQEEVLRGLPGLSSLEANANRGAAWINLRFNIDTDMDKTLMDVISRMTRLQNLPRDALPPRIMLGGFGGGNEALTYFFLQALPGNEQDIEEYTSFVDDVIRPRLESIDGVAGVEVSSVSSREQLQIRFDPFKVAEYGLQIPLIVNRVSGANNISGGFIDVGRRQYTLRFNGKYDPEEFGDIVLEWRNGTPIKLKQVANISVARSDRTDLSVQNGNPAFSIRINKESGANVLNTLNNVKDEIENINQDLLAQRKLTLVQSFDASVFIYRAINLVSSNLVLGMLLAIGILWLFIRRLRATIIVATAIPASLLATFIVLQITGRSLNVISMAGLAFATGMVLDAAIVVLENIIRLREQGKEKSESAEQGATQVWGALLASTATTVAIFLPVFFLKDIEGQLFGDLALTIAIAVSISLIVAVTLLPVLSKYWLQEARMIDPHIKVWNGLTRLVMRITSTSKKRWILASSMISVPILITWLAIPKLDYLPPVKRDAVDAFFQFAPGTNLATIEDDVVQPVVARLAPYMSGEKQPALKNYYIIIGSWGGTIGVRAKDQSRVNELLDIVRNEILVDLVDTRTFANQGNLFGGFGGGRSVAIYLQGKDTAKIMSVAESAMDWIKEAIPDAEVRANPGLSLAEPELLLTPKDEAILEQGWTRRELGTIVRALGDGLFVGEHFDGQKRLDMIFRSQGWETPEVLEGLPLVTPSGNIVALGDLTDISRTVGPTRVRRIDGHRTITLNVSPPEGWSLEETIETLKQEIEPKLKKVLPEDANLLYGGSADQLEKAITTMGQNFLLAFVLLFLLMAALFKSVKDSMLVLLAIPLATVGGILALRALNLFTFQPLDLLTMIGFVILLGLVVNNAILLVHQTRQAEREGISRHHAVEQALRLRLRPIFMSSLTSLFGMLPLLLMPGAGSVIYRGMAAVIVGGLSVSTFFTIILLPCLLRFGETGMKVLSTQINSRLNNNKSLGQVA